MLRFGGDLPIVQGMGRPARVCAEPGCPQFEPCAVHPKTPRGDDADRPNAAARGYDARWAAYSARYRRQHPWCRTCEAEGRRGPTQIVDHIKPVTGPDDPGFWDKENHQPLCRSCHGIKTNREGRTSQAPAPPASRPTTKRTSWIAR